MLYYISDRLTDKHTSVIVANLLMLTVKLLIKINITIT